MSLIDWCCEQRGCTGQVPGGAPPCKKVHFKRSMKGLEKRWDGSCTRKHHPKRLLSLVAATLCTRKATPGETTSLRITPDPIQPHASCAHHPWQTLSPIPATSSFFLLTIWIRPLLEGRAQLGALAPFGCPVCNNLFPSLLLRVAFACLCSFLAWAAPQALLTRPQEGTVWWGHVTEGSEHHSGAVRVPHPQPSTLLIAVASSPPGPGAQPGSSLPMAALLSFAASAQQELLAMALLKP